MVASSLRICVALVQTWLVFSQQEQKETNDITEFNKVLKSDLKWDKNSPADRLLPLQRLQLTHLTYLSELSDYFTKLLSLEFGDSLYNDDI